MRSAEWVRGDCLETSALCRMDRVPHFQKLVQGVEKPRGMWLSRMVVLERDHPKTAQKGNKSPGVEWKVPEKVPERLPSVRPTHGWRL